MVARVAIGSDNVGPRVAGVVLEVSGRSAVVMAEGRFLRVPAMPGWESGEEIWVALPRRTSWAVRLPRRMAVALIGCVATGSVGVLWAGVASAQVAAVVSVDINPSLQMSVDAQGRVLHVTAMDADAKGLLAQGSLTALPLQEALTTVVTRAVAEGYLSTDQGTVAAPVVFVAVAPAHRGTPVLPPPVATAVSQAQTQVQAVLDQKSISATVAVTQAPESDLRPAKVAGLSLGKYDLYQNVKAAGGQTQAAEWRSETVGQALAGAGIARQDVPAVVTAVAKHGDVPHIVQEDRPTGTDPAKHGHRASDTGSQSETGKSSSDSESAAVPGHDGGGGVGRQDGNRPSGTPGAGIVVHTTTGPLGPVSSSSSTATSSTSSTSAGSTRSAGSSGPSPSTSSVPPGLLQRIEEQFFGAHSRRAKDQNNGKGGAGGRGENDSSDLPRPGRNGDSRNSRTGANQNSVAALPVGASASTTDARSVANAG